MSMIAPESYIEIVKGLPYKGLIQERDKLIKEITDFEQELSCASEDPSELLGIGPSPDVVYRMQLLYLAKRYEVTCTIPHRDGEIMVQFIFDTGLGGRPAPKVDENGWYSLSSPEPSISDEVLTLEMNNGAMLTWDFKTRKWKE